MNKKYLIMICLITIILFTTSCGTNKAVEPITVNFSFVDGIPALTVAKILKENPTIDENITINYEIQKSPDLLVSKVLKEEADIAIVPLI